MRRARPTHGRRLGVRPLAAATLGVLALLLAGSVATAAAATPRPWWRLSATAAPTILLPGQEAQLLLTVSNLGDAAVSAGPQDPVVVSDRLPAAVTLAKVAEPVEAKAEWGSTSEGFEETQSEPLSCASSEATVTCKFHGSLPPYTSLRMRITVQVPAQPEQATLQNSLQVQGGDAPEVPPLNSTFTLGGEATPFGVQTYELTPEGQDGELDTQAGSHPFQLTTTLAFDQTLASYAGAGGENGVYPSAPALPRDLRFRLPPGLVGRVSELPQCSEAQFSAISGPRANLCPSDTALGVATVLLNDPIAGIGVADYSVPVFNLEPAPGEPARFGFEVENVPIVLKTAVAAGGDYPVEVSVQNASQAVQVLQTQVTLWGVPAEAAHDSARGWDCLDDGYWVIRQPGESTCPPTTPEDQQHPIAFLTLPTSCTPLSSTVSGDSWPFGEQHTIQPLQGQTTYTGPSLTGCETLAFDPSFTTQLETPLASTPTGINGTLTFPQPGLLEPEGRAEASLQNTTLTLPEGVQVNPSAANGLAACSEEQVGYKDQNPQTGLYEYSPQQPDCPENSKIATLHARTPLLAEELTGALYLMEPAANGEGAKNPFNSLIGLYVVLEAPHSGILVKLGAEVHLNEQTGREEAVFPGTPQLPFHEFTLSLFGGTRAATASPAFCGSYQAAGGFTGWSGALASPLSEPPFQILAGPGGSACPNGHLPFSPSFTAGPQTPKAGALTPVVVKLGRPDGDQPLTGVSVTEPPGFAALLANVTPCQEPPVGQEWSCGQASQIGEARAYSGLGPEPVIVTGQAYLTSGYDGAPFGLLIRTLAQAGPFNLGWVNVRSRINVNPSTAQVTVSTDPGPRGEGIPTLLKGVPVQIKALEVAVNRPNFTFNPTNCAADAFTGSLGGGEGTSAPVSSTFSTENCAALPFHPTFTAATKGQASKANGASLTVKVTSQGLGVANIAKTVVTLPKQLPSRLTTIQKACLAATFEANPASCPEGSLVGTATIHTPIFDNPLSGPAYLVSHGNAAFPDVEFVLQGEGVRIVLDGQTDIKKGVTTATFNNVPDAPFTSFETSFPTGPHSALTANVPESKKFDLCGERLVMPTLITAQNGAVIEQSTQVAIQGCAAVKSAKAKKLTLAQRLARALKACHSRFKHSKSKRAKCERSAHARYTKLALAVCRKSHRHAKKARVACERAARREYAAAGTAGSKR